MVSNQIGFANGFKQRRKQGEELIVAGQRAHLALELVGRPRRPCRRPRPRRRRRRACRAARGASGSTRRRGSDPRAADAKSARRIIAIGPVMPTTPRNARLLRADPVLVAPVDAAAAPPASTRFPVAQPTRGSRSRAPVRGRRRRRAAGARRSAATARRCAAAAHRVERRRLSAAVGRREDAHATARPRPTRRPRARSPRCRRCSRRSRPGSRCARRG